jgi:hypothetical protein
VHIVDREETFGMSSDVESNTEIEQLGYEDTNYLAGMSGDIEMQQEAEILVVELAEDQTLENSDNHETNAFFNEAFYSPHGS